MRKLATIVDFNNIAMRAMFTCQYMNDGSIKNFDTDVECEILARKVITDLSLVLRTFSPDRVIIACDAKEPWRNSLYDGIEGETYKGNREKDENKNWENIFKAFDELKEILRLRGMVVTELDNTEADDLAVLWRDSLMRDRFNVVMVSSDKDWSQLVFFHEGRNGEDNQFCISYNPIATKQFRKIYVTQNFMDWYNTEDVVDIFFSNYDETKNKLKDMMRANSKTIFEVIDPDRILLDKVMCGDDGDNIPTFFEYYKNGKKTRVTPLKATHVYEYLNIVDINDLERNTLSGQLKEVLEKEMKKEIDIDFPMRLVRQRKLVELSPLFFPPEIVNAFNSHDKKMKGIGYVSTNLLKMEDILKDTRFLKKGYDKPRENSIFDDLKTMDKFSKTPNLF